MLWQVSCGGKCDAASQYPLMNTCTCPQDFEAVRPGAAFGHPREFLGNRFVYALISARAKGLSIGVNMVPAGHCTFKCLYCEIDRHHPNPNKQIDLGVLSVELEKTLSFVRNGGIRQHAFFSKLPSSLLTLKHVALSGDGEPTLSRQFSECVETIMHVRAKGREFFKVVLLTNGSGLDLPEVQEGLRYFTSADEIWAKLDAGTPLYAEKINRSNIPLDKILSNILQLAKKRPVIIQSLFPSINGEEPPAQEIREYAFRLADLKSAGAQIPLVQIYSADRPQQGTACGHLPLKTLSSIAQTVRRVAKVPAEVY